MDAEGKGGASAALRVVLDSPSDIPYEEKPGADGLFVLIRHQPISPLSEHSFLLGELRGKRIRNTRLIFPARFRTPVLDAIQDLLEPSS